jgi:positive regulator of sigma E activity
MRASALVYLLPIAGLLAGAGLAQLVATALFSPEAGGNAAGFGGIAGAVLLARRLAKRSRSPHGSLARITRIVDSPGSAG